MKHHVRKFLDNFGHSLKVGDFVIRRRKCNDGDNFKCHPLSFGRVHDFVIEDEETRPDVATLCGGGEMSWIETQVKPFDNRMVPLGEEIIQWDPVECIKINRFCFLILQILWPVMRIFYLKRLKGQPTDW